MKIDKNVLHYYIDLLRTRNVEERNWSETDSCVNALYNAIRTMKHSRKSGSFANVGVGENNAVSGRIKCVQRSEKFS